MKHIIITGIGRTGTTFLVQLFTALGLDTGYTSDEANSSIDEISFAGLERPLLDINNPLVIKSPNYTEELPTALDRQEIEIKFIIIPMRELVHAANSRRNVNKKALDQGRDPFKQMGGLAYTTIGEDQEKELSIRHYNLHLSLLKHRVRAIFLLFPDLITDPKYCYKELKPILDQHEIDEESFVIAHKTVTKEKLIRKNLDNLRLNTSFTGKINKIYLLKYHVKQLFKALFN